jgi:thiol-disulfide isomerase/thioredoxin
MLARACAVLAACAALAGCASHASGGTTRFSAGQAIATYVSPGHRAAGPSLSGPTLTGTSLDVAPLLASGPVVVNVWGAWCPPCKEEQPALERVATAVRSRGVSFVGIDIRDSRVAAQQHVRRFGVTYPSLFDPSSRLLAGFAVPPKSPPATYVLDKDGRIAAYAFGTLDEPGLTKLLDMVLAS